MMVGLGKASTKKPLGGFPPRGFFCSSKLEADFH